MGMAPFGLTFDEGTAVMYTYTLAVMITGIFIYRSVPGILSGATSRVALIGVAALLSVFWTVYCEWTILERLPGYTDPEAESGVEP